ncbi:MAG: hypothetical protein LH628_06920 [Microcoleus sp. CAN_BIN18]|nr:hypothetical protein [Microcoleus sp. CAN_BIN18]
MSPSKIPNFHIDNLIATHLIPFNKIISTNTKLVKVLFSQILYQVRRPLDYLSSLEIVDGDTPYK